MSSTPCITLHDAEASVIATLRAALLADFNILIAGYAVFTFGRQTTGVLAYNVLYADMSRGLAMYSPANAAILFQVGGEGDL